MTKAIATPTTNGKVCITVGDDVIRKSVDAGKYTHVCLYFRDGDDKPFIGVSKSRENAAKWQPFPAVADLHPAMKSDSDEKKADVKRRYFELKEQYGKPTKHYLRSRLGRSSTWVYRFAIPFTRRVIEIENA